MAVALCLIATAVTNLTWPIAVKHIASCIDIFALEDIYLTIAELTTVKNTDLDHVSHLLSWNQKSPPRLKRVE